MTKLGICKRQNKICLHVPFKDLLDVKGFIARHDILYGGQVYAKIPENACGALPLHMLGDQISEGASSHEFQGAGIYLYI